MIGLKIAKSMGAKNVLLKSDSKLVIGQIKGDYEAENAKIPKADEPTTRGIRKGRVHAGTTKFELRGGRSGTVSIIRHRG